MKIKFLSEETLLDLRTNYSSYKSHYYKNNKDWFIEYFNEEGRVLESKIDFELPPLHLDDDYSQSDRKNVKEIYESLKHLSVAQATQERLWAGLSHLQMQQYAFYRLKNELASKNDKRINTALFFKNGNKRSLFVHILARLWWAGYMTYDSKNTANPYWLTDFFTEKDFSARSIVFFSSNFTSNRNITLGILKALFKIKKEFGEIKRDHFVQSTKYFNEVGGALILDMLTEDDVERMIDKQLRKHFELPAREQLNIPHIISGLR
jgi:hypothetical protein